ncbi:RING finger protein unkempt [Apis cerana cerana]|uniref:RING finger protein unkempt n=1 Tax=Apis cerana cerana TaxID=94128 RepID=A0A2A3ECI4_APICC|nr:RING finger protein unkempt [Apis cerana cerana]
MKSDSKPLLTAQAEKANHYTYLKEFRVEQCPLFIQRKCTQHRPFTCFNWHFMNQRRRRPVRKRDRTFNYSADNYCTKYDETTGICPDGDECPFLHRTAGDTERRYHLRYYKTCMCVHDTDTRGFCVKNGPHCAFAHGNHDLRPPVYDIKEIQALENPDSDPNSSSNGPNILDKERNLMNEDPKWQDTNYVLSNYKTEPCKRPPRLCRQGYACPQYHNSKDKRRSPRKYKYRSTPCPNVKHGEEWGEPGNCEQGDACTYCHTRTEQQFHPEIYKSTKCNDVQQAGYCPRGVFCAFAHVDRSALDELHLDDPLNLVESIHRDTNSPISNSISAGLASSGLLGSSAPVNIPGMNERSVLTNFSPSTSSPLQHLHSTGFLTGSRFSHQDSMESVQRLREELTSSRAQLATWDERINQARAACAAWQLESEEAKRKASIAEQQRDEALLQVKALRVENEASSGGPYLHTLRRTSELRSLSIAALKSIQSQLRSDLEEVEKVLYRETATKCMVCEEQNRTVTLSPCNHYVVCSTCAPNQRECPYCQTPVVSTS